MTIYKEFGATSIRKASESPLGDVEVGLIKWDLKLAGMKCTYIKGNPFDNLTVRE